MPPFTEEQEKKILLLRLLLGDVEGSPFYPILTDEEYYTLLDHYRWDVFRASRQAGYSILFYLTKVNYREKTGDIEVWNLAAMEYRKALNDYIGDRSANLPQDLRPWVGGVSASEMCSLAHSSDYVRHPLASISQCSSWWTRVKNIDCLREDRMGCGC